MAIFRCGPCNAARLSCSWPLQVWSGSKKPIVTAALLGPPPVLVARAESPDSCTHAHRGSSPWTKQPLNLSLETQETSFESSYCSQAKRAVSSSRRRLRSILIRGRGAAGKLVPPGSLADLAGRLTAQRRRPSQGRVTSAERKTQAHRLVEHGDGALVVDICCVLDQVPRVACQHCKPVRSVT